jgi:4-hydroxybenzoyl-CoA thioesterase
MPFSIALTPGFSQCDTAGNIHFPRYMETMNNLVEGWFRERMGVDFHAFHLIDRMGLPVANTRLDIVAPSHLGEPLTLEIGVETLGRSSLVVRATGRCGDELRFTLRHRLVFISLETYRAIAIPPALLVRLEGERLNDGASSPDPVLPAGAAPENAFHSRWVVRTSHCDPAGIVFYARYFEMLAEAQEDWFDRGLLLPLQRLLRERGRRLVVTGTAAGFERVSRLSDTLDIDLWVSAIEGRQFTLALIVSCEGEVRLRACIEAELQQARETQPDNEHQHQTRDEGDGEHEDEGTAAPACEQANAMDRDELPEDLREWMGHYLCPLSGHR